MPKQVSNDVSVQRVTTSKGLSLLHDLLTKHVDATGSANAAQLLAEWPASAERFWYAHVVETEVKWELNPPLPPPLLLSCVHLKSTFSRVAPTLFDILTSAHF